VLGASIVDLRPLLERAIADLDKLWPLLQAHPHSMEEDTATFSQHWPQARELHAMSTPVMMPDGTRLGRLLIMRDVTQERAADRMKTDFIALASHELRTPLVTIKGFLELVLDGTTGPLNAEQLEVLQLMHQGANQLDTIVDDLLDISRIESGHLTLHPRAFDLQKCIETTAATLQLQFVAKHQSLTLELESELPPVNADEQRVVQILLNLLSNAHKYTPDGGSITVRAQTAKGFAQVDVIDTGIGLSEEEQQHIFEQFFRANNETVRDISGSGLGLAITRTLVDQHGGTLTVQSRPGAGSTFSFTLPLAEAARDDQIAAPDAFAHS